MFAQVLRFMLIPVTLAGNCDFELGMCDWSNSGTDDFDWSTGSGKTSSSSSDWITGPTNDHTKGNNKGKYVFIETSSPRKSGDTAILKSSTFQPKSGQCMNFYYHMFGGSIGTLRILVKPPNQSATVLWSLTGQQGNTWKKGIVPIQQETRYEILIEGMRGTNYTGDIAIDDITLTNGCACTLTPQKASPTPPINCDFEIDMCGWENPRTDNTDWYLGSGNTSSSRISWITGPRNDHTKRNSQGKYIFIETSPGTLGNNAVLQRSIVKLPSVQCMTFYYHMFGETIGTLRVLAQTSNQTSSLLWSLTGQQGPTWKNGVVAIPREATKVMIEGIRGSSYTGDIALDDITLRYKSPCVLKPRKASVATAIPKVLIVPSLETIDVLVGNTLTVDCVIDDANPPVTSISWSHNGRVTSGSLLHIRNVTELDGRRLTCTADNGVGPSPGDVHTVIRVLKKFQEPTLVHLDPNSDYITIHVGEVLTVKCRVNDIKLAVTSVTWSHNGRNTSGETFHIQQTTKSDEGRLTCTADNGVGTSPGRADTYIRVLEKPQESLLVRMEPNSDVLRALVGENLTVRCVVDDAISTAISVTWLHNGQNTSGSTFDIQNVTQSDEGRLTCTAHSGEGTSPGRADAFILVLENCDGYLAIESWNETWSPIQIAFVASGSVAVLIILILVVIIIHLCRKLHSTKEKTNMASYHCKDDIKKSTSNNKPAKLKTVSEAINAAYEVGTPKKRRGKQESMNDYDQIEIGKIKGNKSTEVVYVNAAAIRGAHS